MLFATVCLPNRLADELRNGRQFAAISHRTAVSPVENSLYTVVFGLGFQRYIDRAVGLPVSEAYLCLKLFARIFTEKNARLKKLFFIAQPREITFHTQSLQFVVEVAFQCGVGIYFQRYLEYGRQYLRIVDVQVEVEIIGCFPGTLVG